ncbi:hypothetical protein FOPG_14629 [Fusarium oxysporum f. sp. conglutinans race 2 54008]|uniref:Amino acid transporter transmembrane domain-containing protein n=1 Tax=Fusarium oxysporum f. sp. conglutinans race 2 54008 TaxID=1089457 RepID=X0I816_FUSOX|nr:hypothetical protein FOPG_14629 [Fusarium oxysporum f. sp. conglutinans race 2 54008]
MPFDRDHTALSKSSTYGRGEIDVEDRFHQLGWKRLSVILVVTAVAFGTLSLPSAFATLGMVIGTVACVILGLAAMYASYIIGEVKLKYPELKHYVDMGRLLMGRRGYYIFSFAFVAQLILVVGSHCLTGGTAFVAISGSSICSLVFSIASTVVLILLAIPPSFAEVAILGYIDFISIVAAITVTIIATGVQSSKTRERLAGVNWSAWPREGTTFAEAMTAITNIVFAYAFAVTMPSFMDEMHTSMGFRKSIVAVGIVEICIYTFTGAILYAFVGQDVQSPALLSANPIITKFAFGLALPVIFISGSINITVVCRYLFGLLFDRTPCRHIDSVRSWAAWITMVFLAGILSWIVSEVIPLFYELLSVISSIFVSAFSYCIPSIMWYRLLKEGGGTSDEI